MLRELGFEPATFVLRDSPLFHCTSAAALKPVLFFSGEAGVSQAEQEDAVSWFIPGLSEAVHVSGADQSASATEAPQCALSHQDPRQLQRVKVRKHGSFSSIPRYGS